MEKMCITDVSELKEVAHKVLKNLAERQNTGGACVLALHGDLGSGKTAFTQTLARELGVEQTVTSPTFVIMKNYELTNQSFEKLVHIDAYRIEDIDEMRVLGFEALLAEKGSIICIEWAEHIAELLPEGTTHIRFEIEGESRNITIEYADN